MNHRQQAFTLLECLIALGIFAFAILGIAISIQTTLASGLAARQSSQLRMAIENRIAHCLADPPPEGIVRTTTIPHAPPIRTEEAIERLEIFNTNNLPLNGLFKLTIKAESTTANATSEIILYLP